MDWKKKAQEWFNYEQLSPNLKAELEVAPEAELFDRFYKYLDFGTGGMRGLIGAGTNRINIYTIRRVTKSLALYICEAGPKAMAQGVVISYDSRFYSREFATETAEILASHGINVYLSDELRPTPIVSYLVREYHAFAGVMITASHNPSNYNGYKIYGDDGCQITLETAAILTNYLARITDELTLGNEKVNVAGGKIRLFGQEAELAYLKELATVTVKSDLLPQAGEQLKIVYTPLHGAGLSLMTKGLRAAGVKNVFVVPEQEVADGAFPTVESPNPEEPAAFKLAMALGQEKQADLLLATDPDADRLGAVVKNGEGYQILTGNQIGVLLLDYLLTTKELLEPSQYYLIKTIVTSDMGSELARKHGVMVNETLTGFKFIGEQIAQIETEGKQFLFGYEESYGYLVKPFVRDKDAIQAALLLVEAAAYHQEHSSSLFERLTELYHEYGYYGEALINQEFVGQEGQQALSAKLSELRSFPFDFLGNIQVVEIEDYLNSSRLSVETQTVSQLELPQSDVLKYYLVDGSWICIRPSGTEPKCKIYLSVKGQTEQEASTKLLAIKTDFLKRFEA